ncbi:MAG: T9SS type A sorting domain-containing protein [Bacteroidota bacterium]
MKGMTTILVVALLVVPFFATAVAGPAMVRTEQPVVREKAVEDPSTALQGESAPLVTWTRNSELWGPPITPGIYPVGVGAPPYPLGFPTLDSAISELQVSGVAGPGTVYFQLIDPLYTMTGGKQIGNFPGEGTATVVFKPAPGNVATIQTAAGSYVFRLFSATNIVFDGSNIWPSPGPDRSMIIDCDTLVSKNGFLLENGCSMITLENMVIKGSRRSASAGFDVVRINNLTFLVPQTDILVSNNWIYRGLGGIYSRGASNAVQDQNLTYVGNQLGGLGSPSVLDNLSGTGLTLEACNNVTVNQNEIYGVHLAGTAFGFRLNGGYTNVTVTKNKIRDIVTLAPAAARPMYMLLGNTTGGSAVGATIRATAFIANNMFFGMRSFAPPYTNGRGGEGIFFNPTSSDWAISGGGVTLQFINNTFAWEYLAGDAGLQNIFIYDGNYFGSSTIAAEKDSLTMYNNLASTRRADGFTRTFLIFENGVIPGQMNWFSNNNLFDQVDGGAFGQYPVPWPEGPSTVQQTFQNWKDTTGQDLNSVQGNAMLLSHMTDPHVSTAIGDVSLADSVGIPWPAAGPWPGVTADIDGQPRNPVRPDAGADEFAVTRYANDLAAYSLDTPPASGGVFKTGDVFTPVATFKNWGTTSYGAAQVRYQILDPSYAVVYNQTMPGGLAIGGYSNTAVATFPAILPSTLTVPGTHTIRAIAEVPGDGKITNDTLYGTFGVALVIPAASLPYYEDFEGPGPELSGGIGWTETGDWTRGTPAKVQLAGAHGGAKCEVTKLVGLYTDNTQHYLYSPIFNLALATGSLKVNFWHNFKSNLDDDYDGGCLEYSIDAGATWRRVDSTLGGTPYVSTNWYNENAGLSDITAPYFGDAGSTSYPGHVSGWIQSSSVIGGVAGQADVRVRWRFSADGSLGDEGWAVDDVTFSLVSQVTFAVDMSHLMTAGDFRPDLGDIVELRGDMNGWGPGTVLTGPGVDSVFTTTLSLTPGSSYEYKFWKSNRAGYQWEDYIGPNRSVVVAGDVTLPTVFFNNWDVLWNVTFQVDMATQALEGKFVPGTDTVRVVGKFNNWTTTIDDLADIDADTVYTMVMPLPTNATFVHDFKYYDTNVLGGWESVPSNRTFTGPQQDTLLAVVCFSDDCFEDQPIFLASPTSLAFGTLAVGDSLTLVVKVKNTGNLPLNIATVLSNNSDYTVDPTTGIIPAGDSLEFSVEYKADASGPSNGNLTFTHDGGTSPNVIPMTGSGPGFLMLSVTPVEVFDESILKPGKSNKPAKRAKLGKPIEPENYPNWSNLLSEITAQGAYAPATSESDSAGGMVIGVSHMYLADPLKNKWKVIKDSAAIMCWVRMSKHDFKKSVGKNYKDFQKTLYSKDIGFQWTFVDSISGFDYYDNGNPMVKQQKKVLPKKQKNALFAELLALKVNIGASQLGTTPAGFGDLLYTDAGNPYDGLSVMDIAAQADLMMTYWGAYTPADYDSLYEVVYDINRAFVGPIDTAQFNQYNLTEEPLPLILKGAVDVYSVSFLTVPPLFVATTTPRLNNEVEAEDEFEDEEFEESTVPVAAKLYQNYPNPFNPTTSIAFRLKEASLVSIRVFNLLGQEVGMLANNEEFEEGFNTVQFSSDGLASGVYFYRIDAQGLEDEGLRTVETRKMVLLK